MRPDSNDSEHTLGGRRGEPWDIRLIDRARCGDPEAEQELVQRVTKLLHRQAELHATPERSELLQRCLIAVWTGLRQFRGQSGAEFRAWVRTILRRRRVDLIRARRRHDRPALPEDQRGSILVPATDGTPSSQVRRREADALRWQAFQQLRPQDRELVRLRFWLRWSWEEIAVETGKSRVAVMRRYYRALDRWRAACRTLEGCAAS